MFNHTTTRNNHNQSRRSATIALLTLGTFVAIAAWLLLTGTADARRRGAPDIASYEWTQIYPESNGGNNGDDEEWAGRAGLQAVELHNRLYILGGRTPHPSMNNPFGSILWDDVWESRDLGQTWSRIAAGPVANPDNPDPIWPARGYFQAVTKGNKMFVLGGQDFTVVPNPIYPDNCPPGPVPCPPVIPASNFFNDVWSSTDGRSWQQLTENAPWQGRSGLSAIVFKGWIYILGGGTGDDSAIGGTGRVLFNDVWRSRDGASWELVTDSAEWPARAGAAVVEKNGYLYLLGGEDGFLCDFVTGSCPYFNDVWRSRDGASWELVTDSAGWSPRPGHQCQVLFDTIVCFGGFGFPFGDPSVPVHPADVWVSRDGQNWVQVSDAPWNASSSADVKYDFDSLVVKGGKRGMRPSIFTFGGDREASFVFPDPMLVDNDVWRFSPPDTRSRR
ncbi:MAG: hypothetical protein GWP61_23355 [Chloroflexi bacterium]|jgi:hypothetical protein|nr:hypothetical protein [Chloroflexota bacterium]